MEFEGLPRKAIVGITGGIGSGKSVVSRILRLNGFPVYDCDMEAKRIMHENLHVRKRLCEIAGDRVYGPDGCLDRVYMAQCIFSDSVLREAVNKVVHKAVFDDFMIFSERSSEKFVFCESAILVSSGFYSICDAVLLVDAPESLRIERVVARNGLHREEVKKRIASQEGEFTSLPYEKTFVVENDGVNPILPYVLKFIKKDITKTEITCSEKFWL